MQNCPKCKTKNDDNATYCTHCGVLLRSDEESTIEQHVKSFSQNIEEMGEKTRDQMSQIAKKVHDTTKEETRQFQKRIEWMSYRTGNWYNQTFGVVGPLLESFIFLIVFRVVIMMMELLNKDTPEIVIVAGILFVYILPLFVLSLLTNYTGYFSKKSFKFKVFSPLFYAIFFVLFCWIISRILYDTSIHFTLLTLRTVALSLQNSLPTIFVFVLLIGYVLLILNLPKEQKNKL